MGVSSGSGVCSVVVSGKSVARVRSWAGVLGEWMEGDGAGVSWAGVAHGVNHHRAVHGCFASVVARDRVAGLAGLRAVARGLRRRGWWIVMWAGVVLGRCLCIRVRVRSGWGWVQLLVDEPVFAPAVADLEPDFVAAMGFRCGTCWLVGCGLAGIEQIQPVLVGLQLGLTSLWRGYGVDPDAVIGHWMGEVSAAVVAGMSGRLRGWR